jgi:LacI family transcriptional regulator
VAELGYRPNAIARSLRARRTWILGLVLPDSANPYYTALSHVVEEAAATRGYQVVLANAAEDPAREAAQIEALLRLQVDGLLWIPAHVRRAERQVPPLSVPTVQLDRALPRRHGTAPLDVIEADHVAGGRLAAEHVLALGHRRIACIAGPRDHRHAGERLRGVRAALAAAGLDLPEPFLARGSLDHASGATHARSWCSLPVGQRPTAILCGNDAVALGALSAIAGAGLRVPDDVSVVGYDDIPQAAFAVPPLTTIAQPVEEIGKAAVERLLARVQSPDAAPPPSSQLLPVRLVVRKSTAPPRARPHQEHGPTTRSAAPPR